MFVAEYKKLEIGDKVIITKGDHKDKKGTVVSKRFSSYVNLILDEDGSEFQCERTEIKMETQKNDYLADTLGRKFKVAQHVVYATKSGERSIVGIGRVLKVNPSGKLLIQKIMQDGKNIPGKQEFFTDYTKCFIIPINDDDVVTGILVEWEKDKMVDHFKDR